LVGGELLLILILVEEAKQFVMRSNFVGDRKKIPAKRSLALGRHRKVGNSAAALMRRKGRITCCTDGEKGKSDCFEKLFMLH
jgi:hypothetical protein